MKKTKKLVSALMALAMVFSLLAVSASAAVPPDDPGISPLDVTGSTEHNLNPYESSQKITFNISNGFNYWKIHIYTTNPKLYFYITKDSPAGPVVYYSSDAGYGECVPTGGQAYYGNLPAGTYYINISVADGQSYLQGKLWYKTATNEVDIKK